MVQARYAIALRRPRNFDQARAEILKECRRPTFAESAIYAKPVGNNNTVRGPSIRFAEAAARAMGNVQVDTFTVFDDMDRRIVRTTVTELESNASFSKDLTLQKTVERKFLKKGQKVLAQRTNSYGDPTFLVEATEDDMATKEAAQVSKVLRTLLLRFVPGDLIEEAMEQCEATMRDRAAKDPDAEKRKILDAFATLRLMPNDIMELLGHPLETLAPKELVELRAIYQTIRDGETTWQDVLAQRGKEKAPTAKAATLADLTKEIKAGSPAGGSSQSSPPSNPADSTTPVASEPTIQPGAAAVKAKRAPKVKAPEPVEVEPPADENPFLEEPPPAAPVVKTFHDEIDNLRPFIPQQLLYDVIKKHGGERGTFNFGLGTDAQKALLAELREKAK